MGTDSRPTPGPGDGPGPEGGPGHLAAAAGPFGTETTIPVLGCVSADETIAFYTALGFRVTYEMRKPYLYLTLRWNAVDLHFGAAPKGFDPAVEDAGACLVMVDAVAPYHEALSRAMRAAYGKVLASGRPRITRFRAGQSRFSLIDPSGNTILFIQRDEPAELDYGARHLEGLARVVENARVLRDFKSDPRAAANALDSGLRRLGATAPAPDRARALAARAELAVLLGEPGRAAEVRAELAGIALSAEERRALADDLAAAADLERWLSGAEPPG